MVVKSVYKVIELTKKAEHGQVEPLCEDIETVNFRGLRMARSLSKNGEIAYLGLMLTATCLNDLGRIRAIIRRLKQIIFPESPEIEIEEVLAG